MKEIIRKKIENGERINIAEGRELFDYDLAFLGVMADICKRRYYPENVATYVVDININLTNICSTKCDFCAFHRDKDSSDAFTLSVDEVVDKVANLVELGGTQVLLQGGINEDLGLSYYEEIIRTLKDKFDVYIHSLSPTEIDYLSDKEKISIEEVIERLRSAGLDSLPGGGAEILVDRVRDIISPDKIDSAQWLDIMDQAQRLGLKITATMMFGSVESLEERVLHLDRIRELQDKNAGFRAFIPWTFSPDNTGLSDVIKCGGGEYLKMLAISRIYLDNIANIGSGWLTEGMQVAQLGLAFGANDMGGVLLEEKVLESTGLKNRTNINEIIEVIKDLGYQPAQRDTEYNILKMM